MQKALLTIGRLTGKLAFCVGLLKGEIDWHAPGDKGDKNDGNKPPSVLGQ
jgi:hypothetical protein